MNIEVHGYKSGRSFTALSRQSSGSGWSPKVTPRAPRKEPAMISSEEVARIAADALAGCGDIEIEHSTQSESVYVTITDPDLEYAVKVRFADHELPPTYGLRDGWPDIDAWMNVPRPMASHWASAINSAGRAQKGQAWAVETPELLAGLQEARELAEQRKARLVAVRASQEAALVAREENQRLLDAHGYGHLTGMSRKRKLRKLRSGEGSGQ